MHQGLMTGIKNTASTLSIELCCLCCQQRQGFGFHATQGLWLSLIFNSGHHSQGNPPFLYVQAEVKPTFQHSRM